MLIIRTVIRLFACGAVVLLAGAAIAQPPSDSNLEYQGARPSYAEGSAPFADDNPGQGSIFSPFHSINVEPRWEPFAPAETSGYGNGPRPNVGYFGSYERVFWSISKPTTADIGSATAQRFFIGPSGTEEFVTNSGNTGFILANGAWGNRWELGYIDTDNYGWLTSILDHVSQGQYHRFQGSQVLFNDPGNLLSGLIPIIDPNTGQATVGISEEIPRFNNMVAKNLAILNGVEVMRFYRAPRLHNGGFFELLYGVRWFQLDDAFSVYAAGNLLDVTYWATRRKTT